MNRAEIFSINPIAMNLHPSIHFIAMMFNIQLYMQLQLGICIPQKATYNHLSRFSFKFICDRPDELALYPMTIVP